MMQDPIDLVRRNLLKFCALAATGAAMGSIADQASAQGAAPRLDEKDPQAQALSYRHDAAKVDKEKFKNYQAGQTCANCLQYEGKATDAWGGCKLFPGKQVNARGWCSAYVKKA